MAHRAITANLNPFDRREPWPKTMVEEENEFKVFPGNTVNYVRVRMVMDIPCDTSPILTPVSYTHLTLPTNREV